MRAFFAALVAVTAWSDFGFIEPSEDAMRAAFTLDLQDGVRQAMSFVERTGGEDAVKRIHDAGTDAFAIRGFRKVECRPSGSKPGHVCDFAVEVDTVTGTIEKLVAGRFYVGPRGLAFDHDA